MDRNFIDGIKNALLKREEEVTQLNEAARIELIFKEKFKPTLLGFIDSNIGSKELFFNKSTILDEESHHDLRHDMDNDLIDEVARKGYIYREYLSSSDVLAFERGMCNYVITNLKRKIMRTKFIFFIIGVR